MLETISTFRPLPSLSPQDEAYIRNEFYTLDELCLGRAETTGQCRSKIRASQLPLPAYLIHSVEYYPSDFFLFADSVDPAKGLQATFFERFHRIAGAYGEQPLELQLIEEFEGYLSGEYAVCLKMVTPETIFLKGFAMAQIDKLLAKANPTDSKWAFELRSWVSRLDGLERQFAPCDAARFGSVSSRVRYVDRAQQSFPEVFGWSGRG
jgi:hypothetical protein